MTDIETSRQMDKFKKKSHYRVTTEQWRHFSSKFTYGTCTITKTDTDFSLWKRKILIWSKVYTRLKYIELQY